MLSISFSLFRRVSKQISTKRNGYNSQKKLNSLYIFSCLFQGINSMEPTKRNQKIVHLRTCVIASGFEGKNLKSPFFFIARSRSLIANPSEIYKFIYSYKAPDNREKSFVRDLWKYYYCQFAIINSHNYLLLNWQCAIILHY